MPDIPPATPRSDLREPAPAAAPPIEHDDRRLFDNVVFHIVTNTSLPEDEAKQLSALLVKNGAQECPPRPDTGTGVIIDFQEVTHIIAKDIDFPGYEDAERLMVSVVSPNWVYKSVETKKAQQIRPFTPDPRFFFSDVTVTTAELPAGDREAISGGIIAMGGTVCGTLRSTVTHIVALNLNNDKCRIAMEKRLNTKIVLPHWFDDCLKLRKRIDEKPYLLPSPEIERLSVNDPMPLPRGPDLSYSHHHKSGQMELPPPVPGEGYNIFNQDLVMLGHDLDISPRMRTSLHQLITQANGHVTEDINNAQVLVCHWRDGEEYIKAARKGSVVIGNLTWLYWMFAHRKWASPLNKLLHYPLVRGGLPSMKDKLITVSNYGGDARLYLESLIEAIGARFTKSMKADNTHLITARAHSEKYDAAKEWNIHIVNHLWLEDSYAKWREMTVSEPRYTHFPRRTNLMEIVGQTRIDKEALEQFYLDDEDMAMDKPPARVPEMRNGANFNQIVPSRPTTQAVPSLRTEATPTPAARKASWASDNPPSTGRKAKEAAAARLHSEIMPDVALYQKEQKRKGGVVGGGRKRRSSGGSIDSTERPAKRGTVSPEVEGDPKAAKKHKKPVKPTVFLLLTAYARWQDHDKQTKEKRQLAELGIKCVEDPSQCTHLAAPKLARTAKFCIAIARAPIIVSSSWVEACLKAGTILDTSEYLLRDPENEKRLKCNLGESLVRAKSNGGKLLHGQTVYVTPDVHGGFDVCKSIVEANGGVCVNYRMMKRPANAPLSETLVLLCNVDTSKSMLSAFRKMALEAGREYKIYRADWLLDLAMTQKVEWSEKYSLGNKD